MTFSLGGRESASPSQDRRGPLEHPGGVVNVDVCTLGMSYSQTFRAPRGSAEGALCPPLSPAAHRPSLRPTALPSGPPTYPTGLSPPCGPGWKQQPLLWSLPPSRCPADCPSTLCPAGLGEDRDGPQPCQPESLPRLRDLVYQVDTEVTSLRPPSPPRPSHSASPLVRVTVRTPHRHSSHC